MNLPEVEVIGLEAAQGLVEHGGGEGSVASVSADLGHEEDLFATAFEAFAHPYFRLAAMVLPTVVKEADAAIDGLLNESDGGFFVGSVAEMMSTHAESGNLLAFEDQPKPVGDVVAMRQSGRRFINK